VKEFEGVKAEAVDAMNMMEQNFILMFEKDGFKVTMQLRRA